VGTAGLGDAVYQGTKCARLRSGDLTMNFNTVLTGSSYIFSLVAKAWPGDAIDSITVKYSRNSGASWIFLGIISYTNIMQMYSLDVPPMSGAIRFQISKSSATTRVDIDNIDLVKNPSFGNGALRTRLLDGQLMLVGTCYGTTVINNFLSYSTELASVETRLSADNGFYAVLNFTTLVSTSSFADIALSSGQQGGKTFLSFAADSVPTLVSMTVSEATAASLVPQLACSMTSRPTTAAPLIAPTNVPSLLPSSSPTNSPSMLPSVSPSHLPSVVPSSVPSRTPSILPSQRPLQLPSVV
jgi:hypothetical protein